MPIYSRPLAMLAPVLCVAVVEVILDLSGAYMAIPRADVPMHLLGGCVAGVFAAGVVWHADRLSFIAVSDSRMLRLLVLGAVAFVVIGWEIFEYVIDWSLSAGCQESVDDTIRDQILGMLGCLVVLPFIRWQAGPR